MKQVWFSNELTQICVMQMPVAFESGESLVSGETCCTDSFRSDVNFSSQ